MSVAVKASVAWNGDKAISDFDKATIKSLTAGAILVRGRAVDITPVDTGLLRNSITYVVSGSLKNFPESVSHGSEVKLGGGVAVRPKKGQAFIGTVVVYGPDVEFGGRFTAAQPFLLPAYLDSLQDIQDIFTTFYKDVRWLQ